MHLQRKFPCATLVAATVWILGFAGCGDSDGKQSPSTTAGSGGRVGGAGSSASAGTTSGGRGGALAQGGAAGVGAGGAGVVINDPLVAFDGAVRLSRAPTTFRHVEYTRAADGSLASVGEKIVSSSFEALTIENDLIRVVVVPEYGGRILSIVYKPTQQELLYQNSIGTPFGRGNKAFYYDWLMVYGGIFPTFPEPEHGKMWFLPWKSEVVAQTENEVAIRMSRTDDISPTGAIPPEYFVYGRTDLFVTATVRVKRGSAAVAFELEVANTRSEAVEYEYWTCTTLAPGSTPGKSAAPRNTEMVTPIERVYIPSYWEWMHRVESSTGEENVYAFDRLAKFANWQDMGIAYAHPSVQQRFWGAVNHDAHVGIFRVADNTATPGLKFWTWGADSVTQNPETPNDHRPYIELWAGHSARFFEPARLGPKASKRWTETYLPTLGLSQFSNVNEIAAAHLSFVNAEDSTKFRAEAFTAVPSRQYRVKLTLGDDAQSTLLERDWQPDSKASTVFETTVPRAELPTVATRYSVVIQTASGQEVFRTATAFRR